MSILAQFFVDFVRYTSKKAIVLKVFNWVFLYSSTSLLISPPGQYWGFLDLDDPWTQYRIESED